MGEHDRRNRAVTAQGYRVLIADDTVALRRLLSRMMDRDGRFEVVGEAGDGQEAVDLASQLKPDLVILDVMMPKKSGAEALSEIREASPSSRIIIFSGADAVALGDLAADAMVAKGTSAPDIIATMIRVLEGDP